MGSCRSSAGALLTALNTEGRGNVSAHARRRHLGWSVLGTVSTRPAELRCQAQPLAVGAPSEVPGAKPLLEAPFDQVTPD